MGWICRRRENKVVAAIVEQIDFLEEKESRVRNKQFASSVSGGEVCRRVCKIEADSRKKRADRPFFPNECPFWGVTRLSASVFLPCAPSSSPPTPKAAKANCPYFVSPEVHSSTHPDSSLSPCSEKDGYIGGESWVGGRGSRIGGGGGGGGGATATSGSV